MYNLISKHEDCFHCESSVAEVEKVFEWWTKKVHDKYIVVLLLSIPPDAVGHTNSSSSIRASHIWMRYHIQHILQKGKGSPYSITKRRVPELIPVLGSQPAGGVSHKPSGRLPLLSARPAVTPATLKRAATSFAAWWTEARWVWTVCLKLLRDWVVECWRGYLSGARCRFAYGPADAVATHCFLLQ